MRTEPESKVRRRSRSVGLRIAAGALLLAVLGIVADERQHSPSIYIIDQAGERRWFFSTNFEDAPAPSALIVKHVKSLLAEERRQ